MLKWILATVVFLLMAQSAFAIEWCDAKMGGVTKRVRVNSQVFIELTSQNEIFLDGRLDGSFDFDKLRRVWAISDQSREQGAYESRRQGRFILGYGDEVFLLGASGDLVHRGFFYELESIGQRGQLELQPVLLKEKDPKSEIVLSAVELKEFFEKGAKASVRHYIDDIELKQLRTVLIPELQAHEAFKRNPSRLIRIGSGDPFELSHYQRSFQSSFRASIEEEKTHYGKTEYVHLEGLRDGNGQPERLKRGDHVYFVSNRGEVLDNGPINITYGIDHLGKARNPVEVLEVAQKSARVVVIRSKSVK